MILADNTLSGNTLNERLSLSFNIGNMNLNLRAQQFVGLSSDNVSFCHIRELPAQDEALQCGRYTGKRIAEHGRDPAQFFYCFFTLLFC